MKVEFNKNSQKEFSKLEIKVKEQILKKLKFIENLDNPRYDGKPLAGGLLGFWRYRSGDYRIITQILDDKLIVLVVKISHRKDSYS